MEDIDSSVMLKEKLLAAGIDEIAEHGMKNFSLRRVAAACGASCAAPYKHFKNKEHFINDIIKYVDEKWEHLSAQISAVFDDPENRIAELCVAYVRFSIGNPLFGKGSNSFDPVISEEIIKYCKANGLDIPETLFTVSVILTGTAALIEKGNLENSPETFKLLKKKITDELK